LSFGSTAHGAGRTMSRSAAKRSHTVEEVRTKLESRGIYVKGLTKEGIVEETPDAYKDVDAVVDVSDSARNSNQSSKINPIRGDKGFNVRGRRSRSHNYQGSKNERATEASCHTGEDESKERTGKSTANRHGNHI